MYIPEWNRYSSFTTFLSSPAFRTFGSHIKPLVTEPAKPQLYETDRGPSTCASAPVTEIFQLKLPVSGSESKSEEGVQAVEKAWREFVGVVERCAAAGREGSGSGLVRGAMGGRSLNLEGQVWVGMLGWESLAVSGAVALRCGCRWRLVVRMAGANANGVG